LMLTCAGALVFVGVLVAAGCGGGGPNTPPVSALSTAAQFAALLPTAQKPATRVGTAACKPCHAADCTSQALTRHAQVSVDCESCHGPGSVHAAKPAKTNILRGTDVVNPIVCAQCHSDVVNDFKSSMHAQVVTSAISSASSTCMRCHSDPFHTLNVESPLAHGQTPAQVDAAIVAIPATSTDPTVASLATYPPATHASVACAGCHDPHQNTTNLTSSGEQFYLRAATSSTDLSSDLPAATPAQYTTINHICGSCHNNRGGDPSDQGLGANTTRPAVHEGPEYNFLNGNGGAEGITTTNGTVYATGTSAPAQRTSSHVNVPDQCVTCHMPNSRHTFTVSLDTSCAPCHTAADAAARENSIQAQVQNGMAALRARMANWVSTVGAGGYTDSTGVAWDYSSNIPSTVTVPKTPAWQTQIPIEIKRARHNYYLLLLDRSYGVHNFVYATYLLNQSNAGLDKYVSRSVSIPSSRAAVKAILDADYQKATAQHSMD
jgi:hypothetical protein